MTGNNSGYCGYCFGALLLWFALVLFGLKNDEAAASTIAYQPGGSPRHLSAKPMGIDITPDPVVRYWWRHWFSYRDDSAADRKLWLRRGR